ncbi:hypothetical protein [Photobacterium leiognathi]|uniref:hypothetical protein n=1 Tax=Photobacterium leiognathi TaxID=553611 RepID=UPI0029828697|nr:hypothetical protein [Photobacterium leiognathi]
MSKLINFLDNFTTALFGLFGAKFNSDCTLNTPVNEYTFINDDGYLVSIIELIGSKTPYGHKSSTDVEEYYRDVLIPLTNSLDSVINSGDTILHAAIYRDSTVGEDVVSDSIRSKIERYEELGINDSLVIDSTIKELSKFTVKEKVLLAVWTKTTSITDLKKSNTKLKENLKGSPEMKHSQDPFTGHPELLPIHTQSLRNIMNSLNDAGVISKILNVDTAFNNIKNCLYHNYPTNWKPRFINEKINPTISYKKFSDYSDASIYCWNRLSDQLFDDEIIKETERESSIVYLGEHYYAPFEFISPPFQKVLFNDLSELINAESFLISFKIEGDALSKEFLNFALSHFPFPRSNNLLNKAIKDLKHLKEREKVTDVRLNIKGYVWSKSEVDSASQRSSIMKSLRSWGSAQVRPTTDSHSKHVNTSIPSLNPKVNYPYSISPLRDALSFLPLNRVATLWDTGNLLFLTKENKTIPVQLVSSLTDTTNIDIFATPGKGKSVLLQGIIDSFIATKPKEIRLKDEIPWIGHLDVGNSVKNKINHYKRILPPKHRNNVHHIEMHNDSNHRYNIFWLYLGLRKPDSTRKSNLLSILNTLLTPLGNDSLPGDVSSLLSMAIDNLYTKYSDHKSPKLYQLGYDDILDKQLLKSGFDINNLVKEKTTYFNLVDQLFDRKLLNIAERANRYSVPTLKDFIEILSSDEGLRSSVSGVETHSTSENLIDYVTRCLSNLISLYPVLSGPTNIDIDGSKITVCELQYVIGETSEIGKEGRTQGHHQTNVFYRLGVDMVSKNFFYDKGVFDTSPDRYKNFYQHKVNIIRKIPKLLSADEWHNTKSDSVTRNTFTDWRRQGRKWALSVLNCSQFASDFNDDASDLTSFRFILSGGDSESSNKTASQFGLSKYMKRVMANELNGPTSTGTPLIMQVKSKIGTINYRLNYKISGLERWLTNTNATDNDFKDYVMDKLGYDQTYKLLAYVYPNGVEEIIDKLESSDDIEIRSDPLKHLYKKIENYKGDIL